MVKKVFFSTMCEMGFVTKNKYSRVRTKLVLVSYQGSIYNRECFISPKNIFGTSKQKAKAHSG